MEALGDRIADKAQALVATLAPCRAVTFETVARRVDLSRAAIGYSPGEFGAWDRDGEWRDYSLGAVFCGAIDETAHGSIVDCANPATRLVDGYLGCALPMELFAEWSGPYSRTIVGAIRLGDDVLLLFPGELTTGLAVQARDAASAVLGVPPSRVQAFGYSNDFQFYLRTEDS
jgi:hypothetical protein